MRRARLALALAALGLAACASPRGPQLDAGHDSDPWQGFNRAMFAVNDTVDVYLLGPAARGWSFVTPRTVRVHLEQFYDNLNFPGYFVQPLLQGDPKQSGIAFARFGVNTTVGLAGFFDPAHHYLGLARRREDMGQTFGVWGAGPGPYLSLPFVLPTSAVRDAGGFPVDAVLNVGDSPLIPWWPVTLLRTLNRRALADADLREAREASVDFYAAARDAYLQHRDELVRNGVADETEAPDDDLYEIEGDEPAPP